MFREHSVAVYDHVSSTEHTSNTAPDLFTHALHLGALLQLTAHADVGVLALTHLQVTAH